MAGTKLAPPAPEKIVYVTTFQHGGDVPEVLAVNSSFKRAKNAAIKGAEKFAADRGIAAAVKPRIIKLPSAPHATFVDLVAKDWTDAKDGKPPIQSCAVPGLYIIYERTIDG